MRQQFTTPHLRTIYVGLGEAISDRTAFLEAYTRPDGRPLRDSAEIIRQTKDMIRKYEQIRFRTLRLISEIPAGKAGGS